MDTPAVGSRMILACRDTLVAGLATRFAGLHPVEAAISNISRAALAPKIQIKEMESLPEIVVPIEYEHILAIHDRAIQSAWRDGAWDIMVHLHPPLDGAQLGLVHGYRDYSLAADIEPFLMRAARLGRLATWLWRPLLDGPAIRRKAHLHRDRTLHPDGGRTGAPPARLAEPVWAATSGSWAIRLGWA